MITDVKVHDLKCWPQFFAAIDSGTKTFEIRFNDRGFKVGELLWLREWCPESRYTGRAIDVQITYVTDWEQKPGFVVMGIKRVPSPESVATTKEKA